MTTAAPRPAPSGSPDAFAALRIPAFRRFFLAALVSSSGAWLQALAIPFVMFAITGSGTWVGASVFAMMAPMALMGPIAGPLADAIPRRNILLTTQTLLAVCAAGFAIIWASDVREPWVYVAVSVVYGALNGFNMPAWQSYVADLVPRESLMNAITLNSTQFNAARALGPSIGGVVLAALGPTWSFGGNAVSFIGVVAVLISLPPGERRTGAHRERPLRQFARALAYARTQPSIITGFFAAGAVAFLGGTIAQVHLVLFAEEVFEVGELAFGFLVSAFGLGAIITAPWLATFGPRFGKARLLVAALLAYGMGELVLTATTFYAVGVIGVFICGAAHLTMATTTNTTIQLHVDETMRGRVMAMYLMVFTLGMPLGAIVQGPAADALGPRAVVTVMGSAMLLAALWLRLSGRAAAFDRDLPGD